MLLYLPFVHLLLSPDVVVPLFVLLRALDAEVLLPLILIQLVVMDLDTLCLVLVLITLWDRPNLSLRYGVFLGLNHFLQGLNTWVSQLHGGCFVVTSGADAVHQVNVSVGCAGFCTLRSQHDVCCKSILVGSRLNISSLIFIRRLLLGGELRLLICIHYRLMIIQWKEYI